MAVKVYQDQLRLKKRRQKLYYISLWTAGVFLLAGGITFLLFFAGLLTVRAVVIEGVEDLPLAQLQRIAEDWLDSGRWGIKKRNSIWLISTNEIEQLLAAQILKIDSVQAAKRQRNLVITVSERKPLGIWCLTKTEQCFYFDKNFIAYAPAQPSTGFLLMNVSDQRPRTLELGARVAETAWPQTLLLAKTSLQKENIAVRSFTLPENSLDEFEARTSEGWVIKFSQGSDIAAQTRALGQLLLTKISQATRSQIRYFDLRVPDRIYYK